ncbi:MULTISPECIES: hypothetical protein [unclassified Aureimonas]|uniref:hypothetical protein n=1 Tax=unclassified Aureimonas TaxID=2615206 RepID=UPI0006F1F617|nr:MULTISPECIES: hypothetical protein [unclassified Aureimonas]KQT55275.1 hypothetical protein ASG62_10630 [Aureimonas sp. Leaf427]KQT71067.1 hypothetical protein ASG54_21015 [Aureimonas sp. Leaf460]
MDDVKSWYRSKTIWGGIVALVAALGGLVGIELDAATGSELTIALSQAAAAIGAIVAIVGRLEAVKPIA